jgi:hypothetical protein
MWQRPRSLPDSSKLRDCGSQLLERVLQTKNAPWLAEWWPVTGRFLPSVTRAEASRPVTSI